MATEPRDLVAIEHERGLHGEFRPRHCAACWPGGAPELVAPAASPTMHPAIQRVEATGADRRRERDRQRGEGWEPLRGGLERYLSRITVDQPAETERDPTVADDGGPVCDVCRSHRVLRRDVGYTDPDFGRLFECTAPACRMWSEQKRLESFYRDAPEDVRDTTLETFAARVSHPGQRHALAMVQAWAVTLGGWWLYLCGPPGRGKTGLAYGAAWQLGRGAAFVKVPTLLRQLSNTYDRRSGERRKESELELLERYWTVPVLVLDEFGVEAPTAWAEERIYQVVDGRSSDRGLVTVITSNLDLQRLERRLARVDPDSGERVVSRIHGRAGPFVVPVGGPDLRIQDRPTYE